MTPVAMRLKDVGPKQGSRWVRQGFATFFKQPLPLSALFTAFLVGGVLLGVLPMLLQLATLALVPLGSLVFMTATRTIVEGRGGLGAAILEPLRGTRRQNVALAVLGVGYMLGCVAIVVIGGWIDDGALADLMRAMSTGAEPAEIAAKAGDPRVLSGLIGRLTLAALLSLPFWHAPALVHWAGQGAGQALFSSTLACWRNKGAFTLYGLTWAWVMMLLSLVSAVLFSAVGLGQSPTVALVPSLLGGSVFYTSLYFTFADCFEPAGAPATQETPP